MTRTHEDMYINVQDKAWKQIRNQTVAVNVQQPVWTALFVRINSMVEDVIVDQIYEDLEDA